MGRMRTPQLRLGLLLAVLAGSASCEINPQPGLPSEPRPSTPGSGTGTGGSLGLSDGTAGATQVGPSAGGTGNDTANGGSLTIGQGGEDDSGAGGAGALNPSEGGAGGETDAGGTGGEGGAIPDPVPK